VLRPYDLLEKVLFCIEKGIREGINAAALAEEYTLSERHLQRLFIFAFNQTLGSYIRSRRLAASLDDLLKKDANILDIALDYGFCYEQSYITAFKREFGITPGDLRKSGHIVKVKPPLQLFDENKLEGTLIFGPEIVMVPQFHVIGRKFKVAHRDTAGFPCDEAKQLLLHGRSLMPNVINPDVILYICSRADANDDFFYFMTSVQVKNLGNIPKGFDYYTFPSSLCARFRLVNLNSEVDMFDEDAMFQAIDNFMDNKNQNYFLERKRLNFDKLYSYDKNGNYQQREWFAPVIKKTELEIPSFSPSGIKRVYKQELPALRFIGKKCNEPPEPKTVFNLLGEWQMKDRFGVIEKQTDIDYKTFFEGGDAYISLVREKDHSLEHWMGMFMPENADVPEGYEALDFPKMTIGVCCVYGKTHEVINYEAEARNKLTEEGIAPENGQWCFRRFNWRGFYNEDIYGKRLLDYCYSVM